MALSRPVGRGASAAKYDLLTALSAFALGQDPATQRQVLRLIGLVTARYNWQRDELTTGQREIARLWSVDERTVKREMAKLRARGWVVQKQKGARGRVSVYGLDLGRILEDTRAAWALVGPDFVDRLEAGQGAGPGPADNVVPLRPAAVALPAGGDGAWDAARRDLAETDPGLYRAWFAALHEVETGQGVLTLAAPSRFHASYVQTHHMARLRAAVRRADPALNDVRIEG